MLRNAFWPTLQGLAVDGGIILYLSELEKLNLEVFGQFVSRAGFTEAFG